MKIDELKRPTFTIKQTANVLGVHERTVVRMLEDKRLEGELTDTLTGKIWLINPLSIAKLVIRKEDLGKKRYPRAKKD